MYKSVYISEKSSYYQVRWLSTVLHIYFFGQSSKSNILCLTAFALPFSGGMHIRFYERYWTEVYVGPPSSTQNHLGIS